MADDLNGSTPGVTHTNEIVGIDANTQNGSNAEDGRKSKHAVVVVEQALESDEEEEEEEGE